MSSVLMADYAVSRLICPTLVVSENTIVGLRRFVACPTYGSGLLRCARNDAFFFALFAVKTVFLMPGLISDPCSPRVDFGEPPLSGLHDDGAARRDEKFFVADGIAVNFQTVLLGQA
jgi:hypothetical protein